MWYALSWGIFLLIILLLCVVREMSQARKVESFAPLSREYLEVLRDRLGITIKGDIGATSPDESSD